ncbi:Calcium-dependent protease [Acaryochloris thomasi RCC1774]|uniref:Calcium-dependent protease n=2 Tax=Acaryochloris TaxID=155977 RepID=A0A2W1JM85_9CYAN|nr:Calcium-dependent protease [Acaryochloris thomasi RCC1774]
MHIFNKNKQRVELEIVSTSVEDQRLGLPPSIIATGRTSIGQTDVSELITRACRSFFLIGLQQGVVRSSSPASVEAPLVVREVESGLIRTAYHEIVVRFNARTSGQTRTNLLARYGFQVRKVNPFVPEQVIVYDPNNQYRNEGLVDVANDWSETDDVVFATPNFVSQFVRDAPPSIRTEEWHLRNLGKDSQTAGEDVDALSAWEITTGNSSIVVAVLDDGVEIEHSNLVSRITPNGRDFFIPEDHPDHSNPSPKIFQFPFDVLAGNDIHGTPCAGVIASDGESGGAVGIAPGCRILPIKIFHADDLAPDEHVANAIRYAAANADILSCSWSGPQSPDIELAIEDAKQLGRNEKGAAIFCAVGNGFASPVSFPAAHSEAIAVGASTDNATLANYSNIGEEIDFVAPSSGGIKGIFTTDISLNNRGFNLGSSTAGGSDGLYTNDFGGTSSATPLAAGIAALMLSVNPELSADEIREILQKTAKKIGPSSSYDGNGFSPRFGFGRVNAGEAVKEAQRRADFE